MKRRLIGAQTRRALGSLCPWTCRALILLFIFSSEWSLASVSIDLALYFLLNVVLRIVVGVWTEVSKRVEV